MSVDFDAIVLGGGPNSLTAAATLAKAGLRVGLFAEREMLSGEASTEELIPGFRFNTGYLDGGLFEEEIIQDLNLADHGLRQLESQVSAFAPSLDGPAITLWRELERSQAAIAAHSAADAQAFARWQSMLARYAGQLSKMARLAPPSLNYKTPRHLWKWAGVALGMRRMGGAEMMNFLRVLPMSAKRLLDEQFQSDALKGLLSVPAISNLMQGPRAAGTAFMLMYQQMGGDAGGFRRSRVFEGGVGALSQALGKACEQAGVQIHMAAKLETIVVKGNRARGIRLANGESLSARVVLSGLEARRTFFDFVKPYRIEPRFMRRLRALKLKGSTASVHLALSATPEFPSTERDESLMGSIVICPSLDYAEKAYDAAKYERSSPQPVLEARIPSLLDSSLAPAGKQAMSMHFRYAPYHLREGDWDEQRDKLAETAIATLEAHAPGLRNLVLDSRVITPLDYERDYGLTEGSLSQGQMSLDQLLFMRPVPGFAAYRSPVDSLYLCGAAAHPGGGLSGLPGRNAARQVLQEL